MECGAPIGPHNTPQRPPISLAIQNVKSQRVTYNNETKRDFNVLELILVITLQQLFQQHCSCGPIVLGLNYSAATTTAQRFSLSLEIQIILSTGLSALSTRFHKTHWIGNYSKNFFCEDFKIKDTGDFSHKTRGTLQQRLQFLGFLIKDIRIAGMDCYDHFTNNWIFQLELVLAGLPAVARWGGIQ